MVVCAFLAGFDSGFHSSTTLSIDLSDTRLDDLLVGSAKL